MRETLGKTRILNPCTNSICHGSENPGNASNSGICHGGTGSEPGKWGVEGKEAPEDAAEDRFGRLGFRSMSALAMNALRAGARLRRRFLRKADEGGIRYSKLTPRRRRTSSPCSRRPSPTSCASWPAGKRPKPRSTPSRRRTACRSAGLRPRTACSVSSATAGAIRRRFSAGRPTSSTACRPSGPGSTSPARRSHRRSPGGCGHRGLDRDRDAFRLAPQVSPDRTGASGVTTPQLRRRAAHRRGTPSNPWSLR